jgi:hypothetical protein
MDTYTKIKQEEKELLREMKERRERSIQEHFSKKCIEESKSHRSRESKALHIKVDFSNTLPYKIQ